MKEEISDILNKLGIPTEFFDILQNEIFRIGLDERLPFFKGITIHSEDPKKLLYMQRIIEIMRTSSDECKKIIDVPGHLELTTAYGVDLPPEKLEKIRNVKGIRFIDLDNFNIEEQRKKSVARYGEAISANCDIINELKLQINLLHAKMKDTSYERSELTRFKGLMERAEDTITELELSPFNLFYRKRIAQSESNRNFYVSSYNEKVKEINGANKENEGIRKLMLPRRERIGKVLHNTELLNERSKSMQKEAPKNLTAEEIDELIAKCQSR